MIFNYMLVGFRISMQHGYILSWILNYETIRHFIKRLNIVKNIHFSFLQRPHHNIMIGFALITQSLYGKVKELVKAGRIEITGGMWIEPDLDMSSGELLVCQRLNG